jgi:hypothetical protein
MRQSSFRLPANFPRRRKLGYYPKPPRLRWLKRLIDENRHRAALTTRVVLTMAVVIHLAASALLPAGRNSLFGLEASGAFSYLTLFPVRGMMGFYKTSGKDGFLVYKIYTEQGSVVEGAFPDQTITPRLRYDRLAMLANHMSEDNPPFHYLFLGYLVKRLPGLPVKLELHSAKWDWGGRARNPDNNGGKNNGILVLRKLGNYDGLRKAWSPTEARKSK